MLRKYSNSRTLSDNIKLGSLTALAAGMVNVTSVIIFFAFTSNVTGHYAILAQEIAKGNWYQAGVVFLWISLFFIGSFASNMFIIHAKKLNERYLSHVIPVLLEIACLLVVGVYLDSFYTETLKETEFLVGLMLFTMGLQNSLTASISNGTVKTTHLTGLTTDLGILFSMLTKKEFREDKVVRGKVRLLLSIMLSYMAGGILAGMVYLHLKYYVFFAVSFVLIIVILYDYSKLNLVRFIRRKPSAIRKVYIDEELAGSENYLRKAPFLK